MYKTGEYTSKAGKTGRYAILREQEFDFGDGPLPRVLLGITDPNGNVRKNQKGEEMVWWVDAVKVTNVQNPDGTPVAGVEEDDDVLF